MVSLLFISLYYLLSLRLAWTDYKTGFLPDRLTCPLLWSGLAFYLLWRDEFLQAAVSGAIAGYLFFWTVYWVFRRWRGYEGLGFGDVKLLAALGAWHGWQEIAAIVFLAAAGGLITLIAGATLFHRQEILKTPQPFGPFLVAAGLIISCRTFYAPVEQSIKTLL